MAISKLKFLSVSLMTFSMLSLALLPSPLLAQADSDFGQAKADCTQAGKTWNSQLNRCMWDQKTHETRQEYMKCQEAENPQACYDKLAEDKTGLSQGEGQNKKSSSTTGAIVATAYSAFLAVTTMISKKPTSGQKWCTSKLIFMGTSVVWLGGDFFLKSSAKKQFKEAADKYKKESENKEKKGTHDSSFEAQVRAFQYLKEEQEIVKGNAKKRFMLHLAAALGYGASLGMAIYESIMMGTPKGPTIACMGATDDAATEKTPNAKGAEGATPEAEGGGGLELGAIASQALKMGTSPQIALASGVMLGWNGILAKGAKKEQKEAEKNIKEIDEVIASFKNSIAGFCPDGREDLNNSRCYCYTEDGKRNSKRTNSAMCQQLWAKDSKNFHIEAGSYAQAKSAPAQGCLTVNGKFDSECRCRNMKNTKTGENACYKVTGTNAGFTGPAAALQVPSTVGLLNELASGTSSALGKLSANDLTKKAKKNKKINTDLLKQARLRGKDFGPLVSKSEKLALKLAPKIAKAAPPRAFQQAFPSRQALANRPQSGAIAQHIKTAAKKAGLPNQNSLKGGKGLNKKGKGNGSFQLSWDEVTPGNQGKDFAFDKGKKYDYRENDIVKNNDIPIWKIISNRYKVSGLKRLFEDQMEKPQSQLDKKENE